MTGQRYKKIQAAVDGFLFPTQSDQWLALLRFGLGVHGLLYCLSLRSDWNSVLGESQDALLGRELPEAILSASSPLIPRAGWLIWMGTALGLSETTILDVLWYTLLVVSFCLVLGLFSRTGAIIAFALYLSVSKSGELLAYGMDSFTTIGLFYLVVSPLPDSYSLDSRLRGLESRAAWRLGFQHRVLQLHLSIAYFFSGVAKMLGAGWWNGTSMWRALVRPPFNVIRPELLISVKVLLPVLGIAVCCLEVGYPVFIWLKKTRYLWLISILTMHVAIGVTMRMYLFALIMIILNVAAFGPAGSYQKHEKLSAVRGSVPEIAG